MKIIIQTPDFKARQTLIDFVEEKVGKLESLSDRILEGRVNLKLDNSETGENKICEIKLVIPGHDLFASRQSDTFENAVQQSIDAVKHQLERWKDSKK
ncbi:HPF/RaiA family ribosome-associated protein [Ohtaekwangia koreensis]|jgi:putative sigma-54 modulation protein|uniref:Putative sigma-54 modulation protein n=1 Tax=Ohtaekwangia koreensis TaxID=688867 RepID=A0A1T5M733_9BACT|nr:HPF/RaiA family ribosome-associated protein [Ohtaekwangia koreensis]SKC83955.1 putative sigma-54 modulation protein [Ohtaekwangia koreensis]